MDINPLVPQETKQHSFLGVVGFYCAFITAVCSIVLLILPQTASYIILPTDFFSNFIELIPDPTAQQIAQMTAPFFLLLPIWLIGVFFCFFALFKRKQKKLLPFFGLLLCGFLVLDINLLELSGRAVEKMLQALIG